MPRKGVPYGGAICSLKERIAELFDLVGEKLHSINGVRGDGQGNLTLKSGDPAVVITGDAAHNEIEIALDNSKLPSDAVSSVNGKTGAVALNAGDIPSDGNSNVQNDLDVDKAAIKNCIASIITEREARQNADAALQTNINAAQASIPKISITPDPYKGIERDAQGRAFAADPASGATNKTLVTANWISQTGDNGPNNVLHKQGDESKKGRLTMTNDRVDFGWGINMLNLPVYAVRGISQINDINGNIFYREDVLCSTSGITKEWIVHALDKDGNDVSGTLMLTIFQDKTVRLQLVRPSGTVLIVPRG